MLFLCCRMFCSTPLCKGKHPGADKQPPGSSRPCWVGQTGGPNSKLTPYGALGRRSPPWLGWRRSARAVSFSGNGLRTVLHHTRQGQASCNVWHRNRLVRILLAHAHWFAEEGGDFGCRSESFFSRSLFCRAVFFRCLGSLLVYSPEGYRS